MIRERVATNDYEIDPKAVAEAIVRRLLAGRGVDTRERPR